MMLAQIGQKKCMLLVR